MSPNGKGQSRGQGRGQAREEDSTLVDRPARGGIDDGGDRVTDLSPIRQRPDFAFMRQRLSRCVALGFGSGLSPVGPGTMGTLLAWGLYPLLVGGLTRYGVAALAVLGVFIGIWAIRRTGHDLGELDSGAIVWDEIVAFWLVLAAVPQTFGAQALAFVLFRVFDIWKPTPIREAEQRWQTPLGVMIDDLLAAAYVVAIFLIGSAIL